MLFVQFSMKRHVRHLEHVSEFKETYLVNMFYLKTSRTAFLEAFIKNQEISKIEYVIYFLVFDLVFASFLTSPI